MRSAIAPVHEPDSDLVNDRIRWAKHAFQMLQDRCIYIISNARTSTWYQIRRAQKRFLAPLVKVTLLATPSINGRLEIDRPFCKLETFDVVLWLLRFGSDFQTWTALWKGLQPQLMNTPKTEINHMQSLSTYVCGTTVFTYFGILHELWSHGCYPWITFSDMLFFGSTHHTWAIAWKV